MPTGWTRVGTPEELRKLLDRPDDFKRKVQKLVTEAGASLHEVYFEKPGGPAYVLTMIAGFADDADRVAKKLKEALGSDVKLLLTADELSLEDDRRD